MTRLRRTTTTPLGHPAAGALTRDDMGTALVPLNLGPDLELVVDDPAWARDLMSAAGVATNLLEAALGLPPLSGPSCSCDSDPLLCTHQAARGVAEDDRDAFRGLLARVVAAQSYEDLHAVLAESQAALERYDRRDAAVSQP